MWHMAMPSDATWSTALARMPSDERASLEWATVYALASIVRGEATAAYVTSALACHLAARALHTYEHPRVNGTTLEVS